MKNPLPEPPLLIITDPPATPRTIKDVVGDGLRAGCRWFMYRDKKESIEDFTATAEVLSKLCRQYGAVLCINGDIGIAAGCSGGGVHLQSSEEICKARERLGLSGLIGVSCHSIADGLRAEREGADYVTLSPIYETASKPGYSPFFGTAGLREGAQQLAIPIIALAGITPSNAAECILNGAYGVAVMGGVMQASEPGVEVAALIAAIAGV